MVLFLSFLMVDVCLHVGPFDLCLHLLHAMLKRSHLVFEDANLFKIFALFFL